MEPPRVVLPVPPRPRVHVRAEQGVELPFVVWRFDRPWRMVSSAPVGGGAGDRRWVLNAQVAHDYGRLDLAAHIHGLASSVGLSGAGVGLLTAAEVGRGFDATDEDVVVRASVGIGHPTWAAAPPTPSSPDAQLDLVTESARNPSAVVTRTSVGTINVVVLVPVPVGDAAAINLVATATEAKTQALLECGVDGTGTATDAVVIASPSPAWCPIEPEAFGGPRSVWGSRVARAVHAAVAAGAVA